MWSSGQSYSSAVENLYPTAQSQLNITVTLPSITYINFNKQLNLPRLSYKNGHQSEQVYTFYHKARYCKAYSLYKNLGSSGINGTLIFACRMTNGCGCKLYVWLKIFAVPFLPLDPEFVHYEIKRSRHHTQPGAWVKYTVRDVDRKSRHETRSPTSSLFMKIDCVHSPYVYKSNSRLQAPASRRTSAHGGHFSLQLLSQ